MADSQEFCPYDTKLSGFSIPNVICGGPHIEVQTNLGTEVIREGESPVGTPVSEMSKKEQKLHNEAEENAKP